MSALILKIIAMITMTIDHIGVVFNMPQTYRYIGRIAFPLYALMITEACNHLKNDNNRFLSYILQLAILAVVSEIGFDLCFYQKIPAMEMQNQILQFFLYALTVYFSLDGNNNIMTIVILWILIIFINFTGAMGYFAAGIIFMLLMQVYTSHLLKKPFILRLIYCFCAVSLLIFLEQIDGYTLHFHSIGKTLQYIISHHSYYSVTNLYTLLAVPLLALYNGQYGKMPSWFKAVYLLYYPIHLYVLALIDHFI